MGILRGAYAGGIRPACEEIHKSVADFLKRTAGRCNASGRRGSGGNIKNGPGDGDVLGRNGQEAFHSVECGGSGED